MTNKVTQLKTKIEMEEMIPYTGEGSEVIKPARIIIIVDGRTPLLTHNPNSMQNTKEPGKSSRIPPAEEEAENGCYRFPDGRLGIKGESFRGALLAAAGQWKVKGKATMRSKASHVVVVEDLVVINNKSDDTPMTSYEIDSRRVMIQKNGIVRNRPKFNDWSCKFMMEYDPTLIPDPKILCGILNDAGGRIGVGDFRPNKNGWFGRFSVRSYRIEE